ncbi:MAG: Glutamate synthase [NADPH] large chain (EC [uncultured Sulfurovum sp.]|uniref:Glutamate synthase [NADPH] large chain (EC) n=1 Tax=uncultured Sulfurovum sp. TaxID=269237 RepID=A0A6S6SGB1_9BACT|nr:MAG: Glutamate synthase [NADPH] large chain (EC [uncultured Sulfurovum sp.]
MITIPTLDGSTPEQKRQEIKSYFQMCYKRYESLFTLVSKEEAYFQKSDPLRHPIIFYYGHTATFFINKFKLAKIIDHRVDGHLESIFAVGVDEMSWDDLNDKHYDWPTLEETQEYRDKVYDVVNEVIDTLPLTLPISQESPWWVIMMGIEHENIHLETSSVLIRQLPFSAVQENAFWQENSSDNDAPKNVLLPVPEGVVQLGKNKDAKLFGWDNEYGEHHANIPAFKASKYLTSNAEYLEFTLDGGYNNDSYWCSEGKAWREYNHAKHPLFWIENKGSYLLRTVSREIPLPLSWPVEVNHLEAAAFCQWKSKQLGSTITLPTEDEYTRLHDVSKVPKYLEWTELELNIANINLEGSASPVPVTHYKHGEFYDIIGNVWQWSRTPIYPFDGFKVHPMYDDFTVPTYDGKHNLINGGSWISCGNLATQKSRYGFRRHFYQHAGFRYIESNYEEKVVTDYYTTDSIIAQYCHFGWGDNRLGVENYPKACANIALEIMQDKPRAKALDIGCAIGRSSFELARGFDEVIGVDFSARFIQEAETLKQNGVLRYSMQSEGDLETFHEVNVSNFDLEDERSKVSFWQADACNLKPIYKDFDLIFGGNLIDRLYDPRKFLDTVAERLNDGGIFILTSPYTWQEESTPKEKWIGGYKRDGENVSTLQGLEEILGDDFRLLETKDVPFVIQETARKHQYTIAQMSIWEKR